MAHAHAADALHHHVRRRRLPRSRARHETTGRCPWPCSTSQGRRGFPPRRRCRCAAAFLRWISPPSPSACSSPENRASSPALFRRVVWPNVASPIFTTGASVQEPRQATCSMVNCRSRSVSAPVGNVQMPPQRILDPLRARHVTRRAATDAHDVFARRLHAEHVVERRHARDGRGRDVARLAHAAQRLLRQIAVVLLQRLQESGSPPPACGRRAPPLVGNVRSTGMIQIRMQMQNETS